MIRRKMIGVCLIVMLAAGIIAGCGAAPEQTKDDGIVGLWQMETGDSEIDGIVYYTQLYFQENGDFFGCFFYESSTYSSIEGPQSAKGVYEADEKEVTIILDEEGFQGFAKVSTVEYHIVKDKLSLSFDGGTDLVLERVTDNESMKAVEERMKVETETETQTTVPAPKVNTKKYMMVNAEGGLLLREGPGTDYPAIYRINDMAVIAAEEVQNNWVKTTVDGNTGWCSGEYLREHYTITSIDGLAESNDFTEMTSFLDKTVGDVKAKYGTNYTTADKGVTAPAPVMIYDDSICPYIFYYRSLVAQGGSPNASDNTDVIRQVGCAKEGLEIIGGIAAGQSKKEVEKKLGVSVEDLPIVRAGMDPNDPNNYTSTSFTFIANEDYRITLQFNADTKKVEEITIYWSDDN